MRTTAKPKVNLLNKEKREFLRAKLSYDQARAAVEDIETDIRALSRDLRALGDPEESLREALKAKEEFLIAQGDDTAKTLLEIQEKLGRLNAQRKELVEALTAGKRALESLGKVEKALESAETWGIVDIIGGGLLATAMKYSRVDEAQKYLAEAEADLHRFQRELADLRDIAGSPFSPIVGGFERFADYLFDGLIIDWVVQSQIRTASSRAKEEISRVHAIVDCLNTSLAAVERELSELKRRRETVLGLPAGS